MTTERLLQRTVDLSDVQGGYDAHRRRRPENPTPVKAWDFGATLIELILVIVVTGIVCAAIPPLLSYGVRTMVFLPRALAVNQVAGEVMQQLIEGGFSTLPGVTAPVRGLRFALRRSATEPALWLAEASCVGFVTSDNQSVLLRLDGGVIRRSLASASCPCQVPVTEEIIPYDALGNVQITTTGALFQYYNQSGALIPAPGCPPSSSIRRVDIALVAQTGSGVFEEGQAREPVVSSVAIRVP